jgi:hypothetical protein
MYDLQFRNQIYVYDMEDLNPTSNPLYTCDTIEQASDWIGDRQLEPLSGDLEKEYTIDGTPEAWHEQTGECGGSSICDCGD